MASPSPTHVLKSNVKRTVTLEGFGADTCVVKRFHAPGRLDRLRDGLRARRERQVLERLRARGLPVPRALAVRRRAGAWELVLEHVPGQDLDRLLSGEVPWPGPPGRIAGELGRLFARLVVLGIHLDDLHAGNIRIDEQGHPVLLDLARAGSRGRLPLVEELASLAAGVRESSVPRFRARFLVSFLSSVEGESLNREDPTGLAEEIEARARILRRKNVKKRVARWWRESGDTGSFEHGGRRGIAARSLDASALAACLEGAPGAAGPDVEVLVYRGAEARERWERAARLRMHGLPGPRPIAAILEPSTEVLLASPTDSVALCNRWEKADASERVGLARGAGHVLGQLYDRGLALAPPAGQSGLLATERGEVLIADAPLEEPTTPEARAWVEPVLALLRPELDESSREALVTGFVRAQRGSRAECARIERELGA